MADTLAKQVIQFVAQGLDGVEKAFAKVKEGLQAVTKGAEAFHKSYKVTTDAIAASPVKIAAAVTAFQLLTGAARSWAQAGLAGTVYGNQLQFQFQQLSQQIAGVFVPTILMVTNAVRRLTEWFRSLSGDQQAMIRHWIEAAAVMLAVHKGLGLLKGIFGQVVISAVTGVMSIATSILMTLIPAVKAVVLAVLTGSGVVTAALGLASAGFSLILGIAAAVAGALVSLGLAGAAAGAGLAVGTASGRSALQQLWETLKPIGDAVTGLLGRLQRALGPVLQTLGASVGGLLQRFAGVLTGLMERAGPIFDRLVAWAEALGDALADLLDGIDLGPLEAIGTTLLDAFAAALPIVERMARAILGLMGAGGAAGGGLGERLGEGFAFALGLFEKVRAGLEAIGAIAVRVGGIIWRAWTVTWETIVAVARPILAAIGGIFGDVGTGIRAWLARLAALWQSTFGALWARVERLIAVIAPIYDLFQRIGSAIAVTFGEIAGTLISAAWQNLQQIAAIIFGPIMQALGIAQGGFENAFGNAGDFLEDLTEKLKVVGQWLRENLPAAIEGFVHKLGDGLEALRPVFAQLFTFLQNTATAMEQLGMVSEGTAARMHEVFQGTVNAMGQVAAQLRGFHIDLAQAADATTAAGRRNRPGASGGEQRNDVAPAGGQFEDARALFRRMTEASLKAAGEAEDRARQERIARAAEQTAENTRPQHRPPVVNPSPGSAGSSSAGGGGAAGLIGSILGPVVSQVRRNFGGGG